MDAELIMNVKQMQNHDAWLDMRKKGIGGSDAGAIMGYNPWTSPFALWMEKTGQIEPEDISQNPSVQAGIRLEPVVAAWFSDETGLKVERRGMMRNKKYPWMLANIDRLIPGRKNGLAEDIGLEIKTTNAFSAHDWDEDNVPNSYYLQCQHYMMATGLKGWWIAVLIGGQDFRKKFIPRNDEQIRALFEAEKVFWENYVVGGAIPPIDESQATKEALADKYPGGLEDAIELPEQADGLVQLLDGYKAKKKELDASIQWAENELKALMGDHETALAGERKITWKRQNGRITVDSKKLKADYPDIWEACKKEGKPTRVFKVAPKKEEK